MRRFVNSDWTIEEGLALAAQLSGLPLEEISGFVMIIQLADGSGFGFVTDHGVLESQELLGRLCQAVIPVAREIAEG